MWYSKIQFLIFRTGFFVLLFVLVFQCASRRISTYPTTSSWNGGFLLNYQNFGFGFLAPTSKEDPLFADLQVKERVQKEIRFQFASVDLPYKQNQPDSFIYYYFLNDSLIAPVVPYLTGTIQPENLLIEVDTLLPNQSVFVLDLVDSGTMQLIWRSYAKIKTKPRDSLFTQLPLMIEAMAKRYPG
jgi:hypothetical protein